MSGIIEASVEIGLIWNDDSNEWEVHPDWLTGSLDWTREPERVSSRWATDAEYDRAGNHPVTAEELTQMLGFAMVRATAPANRDADWRPASPHLIGMFKEALADPEAVMPIHARDAIVRKLVAICSSVDENAHRRGMFQQRQQALPQPDKDAVRAAINDAYYDTRNAHGTMDEAASKAADDVLALLGGKS